MKVNNYEFKKELISINVIKNNNMNKKNDCVIIKDNIKIINDINNENIILLHKFLNENSNIKILNSFENNNENPLLNFLNLFINYNKNLLNNSEINNYYKSNIKNDNIGIHISLMKSNNQILIIDLQSEKNFNSNNSFIIELNENEKIIYYTFNPTNPYLISIITINFIYIYNIKEFHIYKKLNSSKNIIKVKYSLNGKYFIILYKNSFEVYNEIYEKIYDKIFILDYICNKNNFLNVNISSNSKYFTIFSKHYFYIFNFKNFDFKIFYFHTQIIDIIFYNNSKEIFLFTLNNNQLFSYKIIFHLNSSEQYYINNYISYNTINIDYFQEKFITDNNINLILENCQNIIKIDYFNNIILILFTNIITKNNELIAFQIIGKNQFILFFCFENFYNKNIIDFTVYYDYFIQKNILICNYDNYYLTKSIFNEN